MCRVTFMVLIVIFCFSALFAQTRNSSIIINYTVPEVISVTINEPSRDLNLNYGGAGGSIYDAREVNATYNISVQSTRTKNLLAHLNQNMPNHINLELRAVAPNVGSSNGFVSLTTSPRILVSGINNVHQKNLLLNFRLRADLGAPATPTPQTRVVTLTISD